MDRVSHAEHEKHMRRAIALSREHLGDGEGGPFGAIVVRDGQVLGEGWNRVTGTHDPTAHAEMVAMRAACRTLESHSLEGATLYTTCEPCPMCLAAAYWARLSAICYANTSEDAAKIGFDDALIYREVRRPSSERVIPSVHMPCEDALAVFEEWDDDPDKIPY